MREEDEWIRGDRGGKIKSWDRRKDETGKDG
jgi:hypothetical protein